MQNPLLDWTLAREDISFVGKDLCRPECVVAAGNGTLWTSDGRGALTAINPDGSQSTLNLPRSTIAQHSALLGEAGASVPNGFTPLNGGFIAADIATNRFILLDAHGNSSVLLSELDGKPLGSVNFALTDSQGRIWLTVSSRRVPADEAVHPDTRDGYIVALDEKGPRIVADGFAFTNEIRFDAREEWLYVSESAGKRVSRLRVGPGATLGKRETYGPESLGAGLPDGIAFDAFGNLWVAMILAERIVAITPEGELLTLFDDGNPDAIQAAEASFLVGNIPSGISMACAGPITGLCTSITFSGGDLRTVHIGSLLGTTLPTFRAPVAGLAMPWL